MDVGVATYSVGSAAFLVLGVLLLTSWRGRLQGALLVAAVFGSALWSGFLAFALSASTSTPLAVVLLAEIVRYALWLTFLLRLLGAGAGVALPSRMRYAVHPLWIGLLGYTLFAGFGPNGLVHRANVALAPLGGLFVLALLGLILLEQIYRNSRVQQRYAIKYLVIGLGAMFAYDLVIYSSSLMFHGIAPSLWNARGLIDAIVVPLLAVTAARNPRWSLDVFVSRRMVFYSTTLLGAGVYLLAIAAGGYYIRLYGGAWGTLAAVVFVFCGSVGLLTLLFSGQARARVRVFVSKHFFNYRYDYREEWLRLIQTLARRTDDMPLQKRAIVALAQMSDSPGGMLWARGNVGYFTPAAAWNMGVAMDAAEPAGSAFANLLESRHWVFDVTNESPGAEGQTVEAPAWLRELSQAWLVVPLLQDTDMIGFIVLSRPRAARSLNWEDRDLLKTAGRQIASYLGHDESARKLAEARQFEGYNRLTAFVMHDLKNLVAQQSLMVSNAGRHKNNPDFVDDMIKTVSNSVERMNRLLEQLRRGEAAGESRRISGRDVIQRTIAELGSRPPKVQFAESNARVDLYVEVEGFCAILGHVLRNAQDAAGPRGSVTVSLRVGGDYAIIEVKDDGEGMDAKFMRERLFQPFYTTKSSKGMGIGAYQAREFVVAAGGTVDVASAPGEGTTFTLRLPRARTPVEASEAHSSPARGVSR